ncbi:MAG: hypothetical protein ACOCZA_12785 [Spirochaetota bacterium]
MNKPLLHCLLSFGFVLSLSLLNASLNVSAAPGIEWKNTHLTPPEEFKIRNSVAADDVNSLSTTPQKISVSFEDWQENGTDRVNLHTDYHALFPLPIESVIAILLDIENEDSVYPNMTFTKDLTPKRDWNEGHYQEVVNSFSFLGIGAKYHYIVYRVPTWHQDGTFTSHWALVHSIDDKYETLYGSWYVKEFSLEGKPHTYVRNYVETEIIDPPPFLKTIREIFGRSTVRRFFDALYEAAREHRAARQ